ncbi:MAG: HlyC/CorC family transporter [Traorella sp.]
MESLPDSSLWLILIFLILFSAFFSASETAFSTFNRIRIKQLANRGDERAGKVIKLADDYDKLISGILVGNNFVNIFGTTIATVLFTKIFMENGPTLSTLFMTVAVLIFGEITPKTIAKNNADDFVMIFYPILKFVLIILTPFTYIFGLWQKLVNLVFKTNDNKGISGDELITMIEEVEKEGNIEKDESELIQSAIEFSECDIADIYTPRVDVVSVDIDDSYHEIEKTFKENPFSRIPVYRNTIDNIIGFIHHRDFYELDPSQSIESILQSPVYLPLTTKISDALKEMQKCKVHLAVVVDEFGGTAGIITLEDIIEELVGEIWDEHDEVVEEIVQLDDNSYKIDGTVNIDEVFELFEMYEDDVYDSNTLSGWIIEINEKVPNIHDIIHFKNLEIEILDSDDRKIKWAKVTKINVENEESDD